MATPAAPQGALSDDALLSAPGPASAPAPQISDDQLLNAKYSDDQLLSAPGPSAAPASHGPSWLAQAGGVIGRGVLGGLTSLGHVLGGGTGSMMIPGGAVDPGTGQMADPLANGSDPAQAEQAADQMGVYKPTGAAGKLTQAAISGATAGFLDPLAGVTRLPSLAAGAAGSLGSTGAAMAGATPGEAAAAGLVAGIVPGAAGAARAGASDYLVGRAAAKMSDQDAINTVIMNDAAKQYAAQGTGNNSLAQQVAGYKGNLENALGDYGASAKQAGLVDAAGARDIASVRKQATSHTNGLTNAPGAALPVVRALGLPDTHQAALEGVVNQLDASSGQQFRGQSTGPVTTALTKLAPVAAGISGVGMMAAGHPMLGMEAMTAAMAGHAASPMLTKIGQYGDQLLGTNVPQFAWNAQAAQRAVADRGLTVPSQNPLLALQQATKDNGQLATDNAMAAQAQTDADKAYLYQHADAQHMNRQFDMSANQQRAYEVSDANAMDRQRTQQQNFERAQQVGDATAMDQQRTAQQNFERAQQVGDATAMDRQRTQQQNFDMAQQVGDATAMNRQFDASAAQATAQQAKGQNLTDAAGNWMEKLRMGMAKKANPGVPITGPASLSARGDDQVFAATGGRYGSPVEPGAQDFTQQGAAPPSASPPAPATAAPGPGPAAPPPAPAGPPGAPPRDATNPDAPLSGGLHMAARMARDQLGVMPAPAQMHNSALATLGETDGAAFNAGFNSDRTTAQRVANHAVSATQQQAQQATSEVSNLMGQPNGGARGPIQNLPRWQGAGANYQTHVQQMIQLAPTPDHGIAVSQIGTTPQSTGKQAIRDVFEATHPGADMSVFTPQLMKGI